MKLPDFTNDAGLIKLREAMGAEAPGEFSVTYRPNTLTARELESLANGGIELPFDEITKLDDGTLGYKDSRVLVYIRDVPHYGDEFDLPRFHFAYCRTLEKMHEANRIGRYVVANRDNGEFWIHKIAKGRNVHGSWERLNVCQNCLDKLHFDDFSYSMSHKRRHEIVSAFSILRFFEKYPKSLHVHQPEHDYISAPINDYSADFSEISRRLKEARDYKCERCGIRPERKNLHVHHVNGQKNDNREDNLQVLCHECHARMPYHGHMKRKFRKFPRSYSAESE